MKYLAILGRQPEISLAELEALLPNNWNVEIVHSTGDGKKDTTEMFTIAKFWDESSARYIEESIVDINRFGGIIKFAIKLDNSPLDYLRNLPEGKITIGISDYSKGASQKTAVLEGLRLKKILVRHGRSVRVVESKNAILPTATSIHNGLSGKKERKVELIKLNEEWYKTIGIQDIDAYTRRDQARPARDAKVGMLPPKLAQILINLCGPLKPNSRILDPFCGTGVVLQEALLMGYHAYGTDLSERMIEYSRKNLEWLLKAQNGAFKESVGGYDRDGRSAPPVTTGRRDSGSEKAPFELSVGDATSFNWSEPIDAVACEAYLGKPMSTVPPEIKLKTEKQECSTIILGFLKNLGKQIKKNTPVVIAVPAWLRSNGTYSRLDILDEISKMGYNVNSKTHEGLLYHRKDQIVARDIIILRKN